MEHCQMKMYYRVTYVYSKMNPQSKHLDEVLAMQKPDASTMETPACFITETYYESKEAAEKAIRTNIGK